MNLATIFSDYASRFVKGRLRLYSTKYCYTVSFDLTPGREKTYLGAIVDCLWPEPGEFWCRGNDLPDGEFTEETWNLIKQAIEKYEGASWELISFTGAFSAEFNVFGD